MLNNLLLHIFVNLFFVTIFFSFRVQPKHQAWKIFALASLSLLLCMTFPISMKYGYRLGLGMIPIFTIILYGRGWGPPVLIALMVGYRLFLGGPSGWMQVGAAIPAICAAFACRTYFRFYEKRARLIVSTALSLVGALGTWTIVWVQGNLTDHMVWLLALYSLMYMLTTFTVTLLIEVMRENRNMRLEMQRMEKLGVLGDLAAAIAHEVRHPMTVASGFLQLIQEEKNPGDKRHYITIAFDELQRAEGIITDYLAFAKPEIQELESVEVEEKTRQVLNLMSSYALLHNVELTNEIHAGMRVCADAGKLDHVLMNVIKNGIEAMPDGGRLHIAATRMQGYVEFLIEDTGVGMTMDEVARLGNPFYTTKDKGTGLGLMVAYRYVEVMRGKILVQSEKGKGTRFSIRIPISDK
ncbi:ATP-binding protein [Tumebacillus amylolyticus]|uniref:ATP-binding protein n=1 Tax=Tumebacillus amylolyticus TaxID=2801339 RepID=UPI0032216299